MLIPTPRLLLRPAWPEEADALCGAIAHERVAFMLANLPWPYTLDVARAWIALEQPPGDLALQIVRRDDGALIGGVGWHARPEGPELGYWLTPSAWGHGYATEAASAVVAAARARGLPVLVSGFFDDNPASGRILAKLGFVTTGTATRPCLALGRSRALTTVRLDLAEPAAGSEA